MLSDGICRPNPEFNHHNLRNMATSSSVSQSPSLRVAASVFATIFIGFGINAILRPQQALEFFEFETPASTSDKKVVDGLMIVYGVRDIFMGLAMYGRVFRKPQVFRLDPDRWQWCSVCGWRCLSDSRRKGRVESLELCAHSDGGWECVARSFGQGIRTANRDGVSNDSAVHIIRFDGIAG